PVYVKSVCFDTFPFPDATSAQRERIRVVAEGIDSHRKARQQRCPDLTITGMYNVLEKLRAGCALSAAERVIRGNGLVDTLRKLHDDLDAAVADAYGWPVDLAVDDTLSRLVALNTERAGRESRGQIQWLRPEFQNRG
ncbi:MAG: hypothetical protein FWD57_02730, partial [Polyangiaceae bacterium]|nr:hypothetical protein [Polyangiaceae bacterium]